MGQRANATFYFLYEGWTCHASGLRARDASRTPSTKVTAPGFHPASLPFAVNRFWTSCSYAEQPEACRCKSAAYDRWGNSRARW
jgi:hypothetical protein